MDSLARRLVAEWLGTAFLLAAVVGSGIMAQKLAGGNVALALLCNTVPTGAILVVLILIFGPISGAHFNPAVTLTFAWRSELPWSLAGLYILAQIAGGIAGVWAAHLMFELPVLQFSLTQRSGTGQWFAEAVATFGLGHGTYPFALCASRHSMFRWRPCASQPLFKGSMMMALRHISVLLYVLRDTRWAAGGHIKQIRYVP